MISGALLLLASPVAVQVEPAQEATPFEAVIAKCGDPYTSYDPADTYDCINNDPDFAAAQAACIAKDELLREEQDDRDKVKDCLGIVDAVNMPIDQLTKKIATRHPSDMMTLAMRYFHEKEDRAEGLFWFYASQLRWRARMMCHTFEPGGEGALFGAMYYSIGQEFNDWALDNPEIWLATLDRVNAWHLATEERYGEDRACDPQFEESRKGMLELKKGIAAIQERTSQAQDFFTARSNLDEVPERMAGESDLELAKRLEKFCGDQAAGAFIDEFGGVALSPEWSRSFSGEKKEDADSSDAFACLLNAAILTRLDYGFVGHEMFGTASTEDNDPAEHSKVPE